MYLLIIYDPNVLLSIFLGLVNIFTGNFVVYCCKPHTYRNKITVDDKVYYPDCICNRTIKLCIRPTNKLTM